MESFDGCLRRDFESVDSDSFPLELIFVGFSLSSNTIMMPRTCFEELLNLEEQNPDSFPKSFKHAATKQNGKRSRSSFCRADRNVKRQVS